MPRDTIDCIDWTAREQYLTNTTHGGFRVQVLMRRIAEAARARGLRAGVNSVQHGTLLHVFLD